MPAITDNVPLLRVKALKPVVSELGKQQVTASINSKFADRPDASGGPGLFPRLLALQEDRRNYMANRVNSTHGPASSLHGRRDCRHDQPQWMKARLARLWWQARRRLFGGPLHASVELSPSQLLLREER